MSVKVLFVCMGNICRSPTAHGVFRKLLHDEGYDDRIQIESAGTHAYHVGEQPDRRAQQTALQRGIDLSDLRAQKVKKSDFKEYDYVLAMDVDNLGLLDAACPDEYRDKVRLFMEYADGKPDAREVPDPYYGGASGFDLVFDMVEDGSRALLKDIIQRHKL